MRRKRSPAIEALEDRLCPATFSLPTPTIINLPTTGAWTQSPFYGSPIFADLKGDGNQELLVEVAGGKLQAYQQNAPGRYSVYQTYTAPPLANGKIGDFQSTPVVVYVPGIGTVIVAALGRDQAANTVNDGRVVAFNAQTGAVLWTQSTSLPPPNVAGSTGVTGALTIGYLEGNGQPDVIVDSFSELVSALNVGTGKMLWQYNNDDTVEPGAVVADLYGNGQQEVIFTSGISPSPYYTAGGFITILNQDGSLNRRIYVPGNIFGSPLVADLFGNGQKEIITAPNDYFDTPEPSGNWNPTAAQEATYKADANRIYAFYANGTPVPGWPYHTTSNDSLDAATWKEPVAADLYGNGQTEIMDIDRLGVLHVILPTGQDAPGFVGGKALGGIVDTFGSPIVAPITGTTQQDIVATDGYVLAAFDPNGNQIFKTTTPNVSANGLPNIVNNAPAYGQFSPSAAPVLVFASASGDAPGEPQELSIYQLSSSPVAAAWPMLRKTAQGQAVELSTTAEAQVVYRTYEAIFQRPATQDEINYYVPQLTSLLIRPFDLASKLVSTPQGQANLAGALNISDADTTAKVQKLYNALGISSIPADSLAAILYDAHRGRTYAAAAVLIVGSDGNYAATSSVAPWAASIYRDLFNMAPSAAQIAGVVTSLDKGTSMGNAVSALLVSSDARKGYVTSQVEKYLGRAPTAAEMKAYVNYSNRENVVIAILTGTAFYQANGSNLTRFVDAAYMDLDGFIDQASVPIWVKNIQSGKSTSYDLVSALVHGEVYYNNFVVSSMFQLIPNPAAGVLRVQVGSNGTTPTNPNPATVASYTNQLVSGVATQEAVLASMMTTPQYISNSTYYRGIYVSANVRV